MRLSYVVACTSVLLVVCHASEIAVSGRKVNVLVRGTGQPAVVFISGMGEDLTTWASVQPALSESTQTVSYDRFGLGASGPARGSRDGRALATELQAMLKALRIPPPYVLVGHSLGGAVAQIFAHQYSSELAGLVLVDPEDGRLVERLKTRLSPAEWQARSAALERYGPLPPPVARERDALMETGRQVETAALPAGICTVLLTGTAVDPDFPGNPVEQQLKLKLHLQLVSNHPTIRHIRVPESRHYIQRDKPDDVIAAIKDVISCTR